MTSRKAKGSVRAVRRALLGSPHPGMVLRQYLDYVPDAAKKLHLTDAGLEAVFAGEAPVTPEMDLRLTKLVKTDPGYWVGLQANHDQPHLRLDPEQAEREAMVESPRADFAERLLKLPPSQRRMLLELYALRTGVRLREKPLQKLMLEALQVLDDAREALTHPPGTLLDCDVEQLIGLLWDAEQWLRDKQREGMRARRAFGPRAAQANEQSRNKACTKAIGGFRKWEGAVSLPDKLSLVDRVKRYCSVKRIGRYDKRRLREWASTQPLEK